MPDSSTASSTTDLNG